MGEDIVRYLQEQRAEADLPPLSEEAEKDILNALVAVEDARCAKLAEGAVNQRNAA